MSRRRVMIVTTTMAVCLVVEAISFVGLRAMARRGVVYNPRPTSLNRGQREGLTRFLSELRTTTFTMDPLLGWTRSVPPSPEPGPYASEINSAGMRDDKEYTPVPPPGITRIETFGDSFTYGSDVRLEQCWARRLAEMSPQLEVLNYGVGAFGLDQTYLRYLKDGAAFHPHIVFIGYMTENFQRDVNVFRPFYSGTYGNWIFSKPRFQLRQGELVLLKNPLSGVRDYQRLLERPAEVLKELGQNDYYYRTSYDRGPLDFSRTVRMIKVASSRLKSQALYPLFQADGTYNAKSEAYRVSEKIFDVFYRNVLEDGALPVIVIFPDTNDQPRSREHKPRRYTPLLDHFSSNHYRYIDVLNGLQPYESRYRMEDLSARFGHYTPLGNQIVAEYLLEQLKRLDLMDPNRVKQAIAAERKRLRITKEQPNGSERWREN